MIYLNNQIQINIRVNSQKYKIAQKVLSIIFNSFTLLYSNQSKILNNQKNTLTSIHINNKSQLTISIIKSIKIINKMFGFGFFGSGKKQQEKINIKNQIKQYQPKFFQVKHKNQNSFTVNLHASYQVKSDNKVFDKYYSNIQTLVLLANQKKNMHGGKMKNQFDLQYYPSFQFDLAHCNMEEEKCTICLCQFEIKQNQQLQKQLFQENQDDIYMLQCSHKFHLGCLKNLISNKDWAKCPVCSTIFGVMMGDQPQGSMNVQVNPSTKIPGHGNGAIIITYNMRGGHRNGVAYAGTSRTAYLPDNKQGREVLELFKVAFNRKLIFTVGRSVTTGLDNQTVWNGIHHKTSTSGGVASFGYPDPTYLTRVKQQLAAKGITLESIKHHKY